MGYFVKNRRLQSGSSEWYFLQVTAASVQIIQHLDSYVTIPTRLDLLNFSTVPNMWHH
jgi:hypothetical protein